MKMEAVMDIVEVKDICKTYPVFRLNDVSFSLTSSTCTPPTLPSPPNSSL